MFIINKFMQKNPSQKIRTNPQIIDSQYQKDGQQLCGIQAIFSRKIFSNKASSMYLYEIHSYMDIEHSLQISQQLKIQDPNFTYSLNMSALWLLLKEKLKKLSGVRIFQKICDKIVIKFSIIYASILCLNDAKEKIMEKEREGLRKDVKNYIQNKLKNQGNRRSSILQEFQKSQFFNKETVQKLKLSQKQKQILKTSLTQLKFQKTTHLISYLQKILSFLQKSTRSKQSELKTKTSSALQIQNFKRQAYSIFLLCTYLNIYLVFGDWISILLKDKTKTIGKLIFYNLIQKKGLHIINRVLDDAPLNVIGKEIGALQEIYYK